MLFLSIDNNGTLLQCLLCGPRHFTVKKNTRMGYTLWHPLVRSVCLYVIQNRHTYVHMHACTPVHTHRHSHAHSFTHTHSRSLAHSLTHSLTYTNTNTHSHSHSYTLSLSDFTQMCLCWQLSESLPPRTIGYKWSLVYSTSLHGFSLKRLYREVGHIDSPILLVLRDTEDTVSVCVCV